MFSDCFKGKLVQLQMNVIIIKKKKLLTKQKQNANQTIVQSNQWSQQ